MELFDLASWINSHGTGYPHSGPPQEVVKECCHLLCIPAEIQAQIPSRSVPINDLISISFPPALDVPIPMKSTDIFSSLPPILDHSVITALLLSPLYTNHIFKAFNDAWFDGNQSVVHPSHNMIHLPFWALVYWQKFRCTLDGKHKWRVAQDWLHTLASEIHPMSQLANDALHSFSCLGWNTCMSGPATHLCTLDLAPFLLTSLVKDSILDAMMYRLAERASLIPTLWDNVYIAKFNCFRYTST
jgi:hypothetical protein